MGRLLKGSSLTALPAFLRSLDFTLLAVEVLHYTITFVDKVLLATVCQMDWRAGKIVAGAGGHLESREQAYTFHCKYFSYIMG